MKTFSELFKKYRLKAEFETFTEFGNALAEKGYSYEESIFSRWQSGKRIPSHRQLILTIIKIFVERNAIQVLDEANELLESLHQGFLTENELHHIPSIANKRLIFQVPNEISDFTGREEIISQITKENVQGKVIHIYGSAGVGKTSLAIKIAHLLRYDFSDGVLWYRTENTSLKDIFISIAYLFNQQLPQSKNREVLASFIRSLLSRKKVLLILDNVEIKNDIHLLLPLASLSTVIILSRYKKIYIPSNTIHIFLESFTQKETLSLFENVLGKQYVIKYKKDFLRLSQSVGDLPLAVHIFAKQLQQSKLSYKELITLVQEEAIALSNLSYENKNLDLAIQVSYKNLSQKAQAVFLSLGVFEGKDFSVEAIAYMNGLANEKARIILDELHNASLIETSLHNKFRIHPIIKRFIAEKTYNPYLSIINKITVLVFAIFTAYWIITQITTNGSFISQRLFSATYFIIALWGGVWGVSIAQKWGGIKSVMGKAILFFSLGLFSQALGQILYTLYDIFLHIQAPYPSLGDIGYFGTIPLYLYGVIFLAKALGVKFSLQVFTKHLFIFFISIIVLIAAFILLLQNYVFDWSNPLKIFLDFAYPFGDMTCVYLAVLVYVQVKKIKTSIMKDKLFLISIALFIQFLSDCGFIYLKSTQTWHFGSIDEYMYFFSYLLMTLAMLRISFHLSKVIVK